MSDIYAGPLLPEISLAVFIKYPYSIPKVTQASAPNSRRVWEVPHIFTMLCAVPWPWSKRWWVWPCPYFYKDLDGKHFRELCHLSFDVYWPLKSNNGCLFISDRCCGIPASHPLHVCWKTDLRRRGEINTWTREDVLRTTKVLNPELVRPGNGGNTCWRKERRTIRKERIETCTKVSCSSSDSKFGWTAPTIDFPVPKSLSTDQ